MSQFERLISLKQIYIKKTLAYTKTESVTFMFISVEIRISFEEIPSAINHIDLETLITNQTFQSQTSTANF